MSELSAAIEAICMVADEPVPADQLADVLDVSVAKITEVCNELAAEYAQAGRGFVIANVAGGWRFQSAAEQAVHVERFVLDGQSARMSGAALETLAIIAYKQPISRAQIGAIRGVSVDGVLKTLQQRGYVTAVGLVEGGGQAQFFGTTSSFLEKLGIASLEDLPPLGEFIPGADLVETLEQGLRPAAALDLMDDDSLEATIEAEAAAMASEQQEHTDAEAKDADGTDESDTTEELVADEPSADETVIDLNEQESAAKKRWWRSGDRS